MLVQKPTQELMALAINLSLDEDNATVMASGDGVGSLLKRTAANFDPLLMKLIRNISEVKDQKVKLEFTRYLHTLTGMLLKSSLKQTSTDFLVNALAALANTTVDEFAYADLARQHGLIDFLLKHLVLGFADDDVVLEVVKVLSTLMLDARAAPLLGSARVVQKLYDILCAKRDDVEIVFQLVYLCYKLVYHTASRNSVIQNERLVGCLLDLVVDPNEEIRRFANLTVDIILEASVEWHDRIRERRFAACNYYWLQFLEGNNPFEDEERSAQSNRSQDFSQSQDYYDQFADYNGGGWAPASSMEHLHTLSDYDLHDS